MSVPTERESAASLRIDVGQAAASNHTSEAADHRPKELTVIKPPSRWMPLHLGEIWRSRELVGFLAWRDISVRYKQTAIGAGWAVLQPLLAMVVFSVFFGNLAGISSDGFPYPVFVLCALLPWQFFAYSINFGGNSLIANQALVTKVYFPRLTIPLGAVAAGFVDFLIAAVLVAGAMAIYAVAPPIQLLLLPAFIALMLATALGMVLWLSALAVEFRDVRYVIPFMLQFWIFLTPVAYPVSIVPADVQWLLGLNPMAGVVEGFRWAILGADASAALIAVSAGVAALLFITGLFYFRRVEDSFADRI